MQAVLGLIPYHALCAVDDICRDFLAPVCGQAVHEQGIVMCQVHQLAVDLELAESLLTCFLLFFLAHAGPYIGNHEIAVGAGSRGVMGDFDMVTTFIDELLIGFEAGRAGDIELIE